MLGRNGTNLFSLSEQFSTGSRLAARVSESAEGARRADLSPIARVFRNVVLREIRPGLVPGEGGHLFPGMKHSPSFIFSDASEDSIR